MLPLYFLLLPGARPLEVLANRVVWSMLLMAALLTALGRWHWLRPALRQPRTLLAFVATALLLAVNWLTFIWAVTNGHVVDASLGYFMVPLVNVALGTLVLHERPRPTQWLAVALAAAGVAVMTTSTGALPWIGLVLAFTFGAYGLLRKVAPLGALEGMTLEVAILLPPAAAVMAWSWAATAASFPMPTLAGNAWFVGLGPASALPLLLFAYGARNLPLTTLGLLQYISPTIAFGLGVTLYAEPVSPGRLAGFVMIWLALALYSVVSWPRRPRPRSPATPR